MDFTPPHSFGLHALLPRFILPSHAISPVITNLRKCIFTKLGFRHFHIRPYLKLDFGSRYVSKLKELIFLYIFIKHIHLHSVKNSPRYTKHDAVGEKSSL